MPSLQTLAKDTAIYGISSIVGRFLNYLLVPLYTHVINKSSGGYGIITDVYAQTALLLVILTFGMETTFFRFANKEEHPQRVFSTALIAVTVMCAIFLSLVLGFLPGVSSALGYAAHPEYIAVMAIVVALDAFQAIPFAYLRFQKRPVKFAALKMLFIVLNIAINLLVFIVLPRHAGWPIEVGNAFTVNLVCTASVTLFFWRELRDIRFGLDVAMLRRMLSYTWPILLLGIAGILNQTADKMILPRVLGGHEGQVQLGIYGAAVKIAMIMAMITQAFRYAYEPFVFAGAKEKGSRDTYARAMKFFVIFTLLAFLCVMGYMDILKHIIQRDYWDGLRAVPVVMVAEILMGVYFNLSFWYKLTDRTIWGAWFSGAGCIVLVAVNVLCIPTYGFMACAWAGVAGYGTATLLSYFVGQHYYPIRYPLGSIFVYVALAALFYGAMTVFTHFIEDFRLHLLFNTACILAFVGHIAYHDLPLHNILARLRHKK